MTTSSEALAREFSHQLKQELTSDEIKQVVMRNRTEHDDRICHSHDFCDANMILHEVFMNHGMDIADEGGRERWGALWDEAWRLAKSADFWLT